MMIPFLTLIPSRCWCGAVDVAQDAMEARLAVRGHHARRTLDEVDDEAAYGSAGTSDADADYSSSDGGWSPSDLAVAAASTSNGRGGDRSERPARHGPFDPRRVAVRAGNFVTPELLGLFTGAAGGDRAAAEVAVSRRAWALLREWSAGGGSPRPGGGAHAGSLLREIALLSQHAGACERASAKSGSSSSGSESGEDGAEGGGGGAGEGRHGSDVEPSAQKYWHFLLGHYHEVRYHLDLSRRSVCSAAVSTVPDAEQIHPLGSQLRTSGTARVQRASPGGISLADTTSLRHVASSSRTACLMLSS
jgi:hypothetical protein